MSDIRDFTGKNRKFTGTGGIKVPEGTTGQRVSTTGTFRFNTTTGKFEGFDGTNFAQVIVYPSITSFTPLLVTNDASNIVITGTNFTSGSAASVVNLSTALSTTANSTTIDSTTQITANFTIPTDGNYKVRVTTAEGAVSESSQTLVVSDVPVFSTAAGSLGNVNINTAGSFTIVASESATFELISGSLPPGFSLNPSTGVISGTDSTTSSDTTYSFTIRATDAQSQTATRSFSIFVDTFTASGGTITTYGTSPAAYKVHTFTSPGGTFTVSGSRSMDILLAASGGSGGGYHAGGGGSGGLIVLPANTITTGSYPISVGGTTPNPASPASALNGSNTTGFGQTAVGGGRGGNHGSGEAAAGGSGGGGRAAGGTGPGGASNQGSVVSPRTGTSYGNSGGSGGDGPGPSRHAGGGGGGAGGGGGNGGPGQDVGNGGVGLQNSFRTGSNEYYSGGGGGGAWDGQRGTGGSGGGGNGTRYNNNEGDKNAGFYGGGGGGNGGNGSPLTGGTGYEGVVVIRYLT